MKKKNKLWIWVCQTWNLYKDSHLC